MSRYVRYKLTLKKSAGGCDGRAKSVAERSYPTSEVRGRSREDPMPEGQRPRGVTPRPRSGAVVEMPDCNGAGTAKSYPSQRSGAATRGVTLPPRSRAAARRSYSTPPSLRPGAVASRSYLTPPSPRPRAMARRTNPTSKEPWLFGRRRA